MDIQTLVNEYVATLALGEVRKRFNLHELPADEAERLEQTAVALAKKSLSCLHQDLVSSFEAELQGCIQEAISALRNAPPTQCAEGIKGRIQAELDNIRVYVNLTARDLGDMARECELETDEIRIDLPDWVSAEDADDEFLGEVSRATPGGEIESFDVVCELIEVDEQRVATYSVCFRE